VPDDLKAANNLQLSRHRHIRLAEIITLEQQRLVLGEGVGEAIAKIKLRRS
jgi:hypothetical protein